MPSQNVLTPVKVSYHMRREMERRYLTLHPSNPSLNEKTVHKNKASRLAGILGELMFERLYPDARQSKDMSYDYVYRERRIDVKCKLRSQPAELRNEASIFSYQLEKCTAEVFYFLSTIPSYEVVWLCGWIGRKELLQHPAMRKWKKGETDPTNGKVFGADTINLGYAHLREIRINSLL